MTQPLSGMVWLYIAVSIGIAAFILHHLVRWAEVKFEEDWPTRLQALCEQIAEDPKWPSRAAVVNELLGYGGFRAHVIVEIQDRRRIYVWMGDDAVAAERWFQVITRWYAWAEKDKRNTRQAKIWAVSHHVHQQRNGTPVGEPPN